MQSCVFKNKKLKFKSGRKIKIKFKNTNQGLKKKKSEEKKPV